MRTRNVGNRLAAAVAGVGFGLLVQSFARADVVTWTGGAGADDNWSNKDNWGGVSVAGNDAVFNDTDVTGQGAVNNLVDQTLSLNTLRYQNLSSNGGFHTTMIPQGVTLTISGTVAGATPQLGPIALGVGTETEQGATAQVYAQITGAGSLVVNSPTADIQIRQGDTASGNHQAVLDLSGLANFTATVDQLNVGFNSNQPPLNRTSGKLILGDVTNITAGNARSIIIGGTNSNAGSESQIELGRDTTFNGTLMQVGNVKASGRIYFRLGQTDAIFHIRGSNGASTRMDTLAIGDNFNSGSTSGSITGTMDLTGGAADFMVNTLYVGRSPNNTGSSGTPVARGVLTFEKGTIDTNTLEVGFQTTSSGYNAAGTVTVNADAILAVNNDLRMGRTLGGTGNTNGDLVINGGTVRVGGNIVDGGGVTSITLNTGTIDMQAAGDASPGEIHADTIQLNAGTVHNASLISGNMIALGGTTLTGNTSYEITGAGEGFLDASGQGTLTLQPGAALRGTGSVFGGVAVSGGGAAISPGSGTVAGTLNLSSDLTLNAGSTLNFKLSNSTAEGGGVNDLINVAGALSLSGTSSVSLQGINGGPVSGTYRLINYGMLASGSGTNLVVAGLATQTRRTFTIDDTTPGQINLVVAGSDPALLTWRGGANAKWNVVADPNWDNQGTADKFYQQDTVTFDDTSTNPAPVEIVGQVRPSAVTVDATRNYTFTGDGYIGGGAILTKRGTGTLVLANTGANDYAGGTFVQGGTLQVGDGGTTGSLGVAGGVGDDATLAFDRSDAVTYAGVISGAGAVQQLGSGTLTLGAANTYAGQTTIAPGGTIVVTNASAANGVSSLGSVPGDSVTVQAGGTLDLSGNTAANALNFGQKQFNIAGAGVGGNGAIVNNGVAQQNTFQRVALTADATIAGSQRIDIRAGQSGGVNVAQLDLAGHTLTKNGTNQFSLVATDVTDGDIIVNGGTFSIETTTSIGGTNTITYNANTTAQFFSNTADTSTVTRAMLFNGPGIQIGSASNNNNSIIASPVTLNADVTFTNLNNTTATSQLTMAGNIGQTNGPRSITKNGPTVLNLNGANTYSGTTTVNGGTLRVNGSIAPSAVAVNNSATFDAPVTQSVRGLAVNAGGSVLLSSTASPATVLKVGDNVNATPLSVAGGTAGGRIELNANGLVVDVPAGSEAATIQTVREAIASGYNGGAWGGPGITSANASLDPSGHGVGYAISSGGSFLGMPVDDSSIVIRYTLLGDATVDGTVDFNDLVKLAQNYNVTDGTRTWDTGDFTYDGNVDFNDLVKLAQNYNISMPAAGSIPGATAAFETDLGRAFAAVPEPGTLGLFAACGLASLTRRRRRRQVEGFSY